MLEIQYPIGLFMPQGESFIYSVGHEIWTVHASDGVVLDQQHEDAIIQPNMLRSEAGSGPIYFRTLQREIVRYDASRKQIISRMPAPEMEDPILGLDGRLYAYDSRSVFALDFTSGEKWRIAAGPDRKFLLLNNGDDYLWALRDDNVVEQIDRATGKIVKEHATLWQPKSYRIRGSHFYAFTKDGLAYALSLR
jgi:hypothetical protein